MSLLTELWKSGCASYKDAAPTALVVLTNWMAAVIHLAAG